MKRTVILLLALPLLAAGPAMQASSSSLAGTSRADLSRNDLSMPQHEAIQVLVGFEPGAAAARHSHPGEELVYVVAGTLEYRLDGLTPVTLEAGQVLFIPNGRVHAVRNVGSVRAAELATYIVEKGKPLLVPAQ
jgi:quercetin dioxygenase-like cupin family protein